MNDLDLSYGVRHGFISPEEAADLFLEKHAATMNARALRAAIIQQQFDIGNLTEGEARALLAAPLTPGDDSTFYDDSDQLRAEERINGNL